MRWLIVAMLAACRHGVSAPPAPTCSATADHVLSLLEPKDDHARDVRAVFEARCTTDHWAPDVRSCVVSTTSLKDPKHCKQKLPLGQRSQLETDLAAAAARAKERAIPASCREYTRLLDRLVECDQLPQAARDAMRQGYEAMRKGWTDLEGDAKASAELGCRAAVDAVKQAGSAMGCTLL